MNENILTTVADLERLKADIAAGAREAAAREAWDYPLPDGSNASDFFERVRRAKKEPLSVFTLPETPADRRLATLRAGLTEAEQFRAVYQAGLDAARAHVGEVAARLDQAEEDGLLDPPGIAEDVLEDLRQAHQQALESQRIAEARIRASDRRIADFTVTIGAMAAEIQQVRRVAYRRAYAAALREYLPLLLATHERAHRLRAILTAAEQEFHAGRTGLPARAVPPSLLLVPGADRGGVLGVAVADAVRFLKMQTQETSDADHD